MTEAFAAPREFPPHNPSHLSQPPVYSPLSVPHVSLNIDGSDHSPDLQSRSPPETPRQSTPFNPHKLPYAPLSMTGDQQPPFIVYNVYQNEGDSNQLTSPFILFVAGFCCPFLWLIGSCFIRNPDKKQRLWAKMSLACFIFNVIITIVLIALLIFASSHAEKFCSINKESFFWC
ncbi:uncharacterized protein VTP21DRAFT_1329 [Calcarisporiella thermophila]|uniref:uncharacterized protein n=1 Tax=Calcarisporiella thermophila TaxID=911321 RepID=UPI003743096B